MDIHMTTGKVIWISSGRFNPVSILIYTQFVYHKTQSYGGRKLWQIRAQIF